MSVETQKLPMRPTTAAEFSLVEMKMADEDVKRWMGSCHRVVWPLTPPHSLLGHPASWWKLPLNGVFWIMPCSLSIPRILRPLRLGFFLAPSLCVRVHFPGFSCISNWVLGTVFESKLKSINRSPGKAIGNQHMKITTPSCEAELCSKYLMEQEVRSCVCVEKHYHLSGFRMYILHYSRM